MTLWLNLGLTYLPDHAIPHAAHPLAMLAVGHQVQVIGELDYLGQLFEDVDAEALATELGVGGYIPAAAATTISQNPAQLSTPAAPPSLAYGPHPLPKHETHTQQLTHPWQPPAHTGPEGVVALSTAGHSIGYTATCARVRALHNDKGTFLQCGHRQVPAVHHRLQRCAVARPYWVLHVQDSVIPAPHLQRTTGLSQNPRSCSPHLVSRQRFRRPSAKATNPRNTQGRQIREAWAEALEDRETRQGLNI